MPVFVEREIIYHRHIDGLGKNIFYIFNKREIIYSAAMKNIFLKLLDFSFIVCYN